MTDEVESSSMQFVIALPQNAKAALALLQQRMGEPSFEATIERAFREFVKEMGVSFEEERICEEHLEGLTAIGKRSAGNVQSFEHTGKIVINLPNLEENGWDALRDKTGLLTSRDILSAALQYAHHVYVI